MNIIINGEKIDYQLDAEKNLSAVISQIQDWAQSQGAVINNIYLNEKPLSEHVKTEQIMLSEVWSLELSLVSEKEQLIERLVIIKEFCDRWCVALGKEVAKEYKEEWQQVKKQVVKLLPSFPVQALDLLLQEELPNQQLIASELKHLIEQLAHFQVFLQDDEKYQRMITKQLGEIWKDLQDVGTLLHRSGQQALISLLARVFSWLSDLERLARRDNKCLKLYQRLHPQLEKLEVAMTNKDWLLVGDLLEYEILNQFENLFKYLENLTNKESERSIPKN